MPRDDIIRSAGHSQHSALLTCDHIASPAPRRQILSEKVRVTAILS
jgi:hypothetical protein